MIQQAIENYPKGSYFYSATNNLNSPIKVTSIRYSESKDRDDRISKLNRKLVKMWNEVFPDKPNKIEHTNLFFQNFAKKQIKELNYLKQTENDIVEDSGGIIYCGETKVWAKKFAN